MIKEGSLSINVSVNPASKFLVTNGKSIGNIRDINDHIYDSYSIERASIATYYSLNLG